MRMKLSLFPSGVFCSMVFCSMLCLSLAAPLALAQSVISARSGIVHYVEGAVTIDGTATNPKFGQFPEIRKDQILATEEGRAEILLTPGVFLRLGENGSVRMISNSLANTRVEMLTGSALLEVAQLLPDNAVTFVTKGSEISFAKKGLFRMDVDADGGARLRVYDGQAAVSKVLGESSEKLLAKKAHQIDLTGDKLADTKFPADETDPLYRWSARRAGYIATANLVSARVAGNSDNGGSSSSFLGGRWSWNPYMGMFSYLPASGIVWSPFGSAYYSPGVAYYVTYVPSSGFSANGGATGIGTLRPRSGVSAGSVAPPSASRVPVFAGAAVSSPGGFGGESIGHGSSGVGSSGGGSFGGGAPGGARGSGSMGGPPAGGGAHAGHGGSRN